MAILGPASGKFSAGLGRNRSGMAVTLRIVGLGKLQQEFRKTENNIDSLMTKLIHRHALAAAKLANRAVPVDTGRLIRSIKVERWTRGAAVMALAPYAAYVEGRDNQGIPRGRKPQPFLFDNVDKEVDKLMKKLPKLMFK